MPAQLFSLSERPHPLPARLANPGRLCYAFSTFPEPSQFR
jgi:hypothetical protein